MKLKNIIIGLIFTLLILNTYPESFAITKKNELEQQLNVINTEIDKAKEAFNNLENQKKDLNDQVSSVKSDITKLISLIAQTELVINDLKIKIPENEAKITILEGQIYKLYKDIQFSSVRSKAETLLTSSNFSDFVTKLYGLGAVQDEADKVNLDLKDSLKFLNDQKLAQESLLKKQVDSKGLLNSRKSNLESLVTQTNNKQQEYEKELTLKKDNIKKIQEEIALLPKPVLSYIYSNGGDPNVRGNSNGPCYFYETRPLIFESNTFIQPTSGSWSNNFNCYPWSWSWQKNGHDGIDIANGTGTPIYATADGIVSKKGFDFGNDVSIRHELKSGQTVYSLYGHLNTPAIVQVGQSVKQGQLIANMGSTGFSTGPHLHFMIISDTYETFGPWCSYGNRQAKCYNPAKILGLEQ